MSQRTRVINDISIGYRGVNNEKLRDIRVYAEGGAVQVWVEIANRSEAYEALQYLSPRAVMEFAKAFERCAIEALR